MEQLDQTLTALADPTRRGVVERLSRDARLLPIGGGTQEIMREIICRSMGL